MMKKYFFGFLLIISSASFAQKDTSEILDAGAINKVQIDTDEVFVLNIIASQTHEINIKTHSEGEYFNDIILKTSVVDNELKITTEYPQELVGGYDKLSAHKVFSLKIDLEIPENLEITIRSNIASVEGQGNFKSIYADLKQGYCTLLNFSGVAVINTYSGDILVETSNGLIEASSRNGEVVTPDFLSGRNPLRLTSIDGNIMVRKN